MGDEGGPIYPFYQSDSSFYNFVNLTGKINEVHFTSQIGRLVK